MQEHPSVEELSMAYTCRTCLNTDSSQLLISIFEDHESSGKCSFNLLDQLMLLGLKIHRDDGFPVNICSCCVERLATIVAFRTQCEEAREFLEIYFTELPQKQPEFNTREDIEYVDVKFLVETTPHELQDVNQQQAIQCHEEPLKKENDLDLDLYSSLRDEVHLEQHPINHEDVKNVEVSYSCMKCGKGFLKAESLSQHEGHGKCVSLEDPTGRFCLETFPSVTHLEEHINNDHPPDRPHSFPKCKKTFQSVSNRNIHLQLHTEPVQCGLCEKIFRSKRYLTKHTKNVHTVTNHHCEQCGAIFTSTPKYKYHLKTHLKTHETDKKYKCSSCSKSFLRPQELRNHERTHTSQRPFLCNVCGNTFKRVEHLRFHINGVHLKRKPYSCEICNKSFAQSGDRNAHMRTHMAEKPHRCSYCGKGFSLAKALRAHVRLHTGVSSALATHTQKHQEEEQIEITKTDKFVSETLM